MSCYELTVSPEVLSEHIEHDNWMVFDCQANPAIPEEGRSMFKAKHIPGATHICLDTDLSSQPTADSGRHPLPDPAVLIEKLRRWGVNKDMQLVAYDSAGGVMAVRFWWTLRHWFGHKCTALLDGGMEAWEANGYSLSAEATPARAEGNFDATPNDDAWVSTDELTQAAKKGEAVILDARAPERYRGESEPVDTQAGHIPTAVCMPMLENLNDDKRLRSNDELRKRFEHINRPVIHSCASGVTACLNLLSMESAGLPPGRLHPGSWSEWIRDPKRTIATGEEPGSL